ncbi:hypothetical protein J437_LFUL010035 [Ladona fulva]|uniref:Nose resistant-to-fluoxetine protein N-terminal domain-containing protein n=1 Tax=Ladona fulva TaxID=123851 RepID=A0A8K0K8U7_LADFU|nr:hypothetical protein J437_LFUL010035 [Ladona fulva]
MRIHSAAAVLSTIALASAVLGDFPRSQMAPVVPIVVGQIASEGFNSLCRNHSAAFLKELEAYTLWAVQIVHKKPNYSREKQTNKYRFRFAVFDSSAKYPEGVLSGNTYHMGNFDECVGVRVDLSGDGEDILKGQYCLAEVTYEDTLDVHSNASSDPYSMHYDPKSSAWNKLQNAGDPTKARRDVLHWAICIPASCSPAEVEDAMQKAAERVRQTYKKSLKINVKVPRHLCQTDREEEVMSPVDIAFSLFSASLLILVIAATSYEINCVPSAEAASKLGLPKQIFLCFSAKKNIKSIFQVKPTENRLDCIHGSRFMSMMLIIMGHRVKSCIGGALFNPEVVEEAYRSPAGSLLINGLIIVDTFFVYGGLLTTYFLLIELEKRGSLNLFTLCILRFLRLTPVYIIVVFFHATLFHKIGSGPLWESKIGMERDRCISSWWTNLLYVNNYVNADKMCMFQSWYMSCDMHFFIISIIIVYLLHKKPMLGMSMLGLATFLSVATPFLIIFNEKKDAILLPYISNLKEIQSNENFISFYVKSHTRAGPYMVGVITGYFLYKLHDSKFRMTKTQSHIGLTSCLMIGLATMVSGYVFYFPGNHYNALESAIYGSFFRISWAAAVGFGLFVFTKGNLGFVQKILQWKAMVPLSRLTYCAYLTHTIVQMYFIGSLRTSEYNTVPLVLWQSCADIFMTFFFSVILCLTIEAPTRAIEKVLLRRK